MKLLQIFIIDFFAKIWYYLSQIHSTSTPNHQLQRTHAAELGVRSPYEQGHMKGGI